MEKKNYHLLMFDIFDPNQETVSSSNQPYGFHNNDSLKSCSNRSTQKIPAETTSQTIPIVKSKKRVKKPKKIPRPPNSFILYRKAKQEIILAKNEKISLAEVSKVIAQMWRKEDEREKLRWSVLADKAKLKHIQDYPDYVYRPKRSTKKSSIKKPRTNKRKSTQHNDKLDKSTSGPIDRSTTTHDILHDHWSNHRSSSTNHMTYHQQCHYVQHPPTHENYISQCFNSIGAETYNFPRALRVNKFDPFLNVPLDDKFLPHNDYFFKNFDTTSVSYYADQSNSINGELFYYNPTTSSSSTMLGNLETYFDESVSPFPAIVEDVKSYYKY